MTWRLVLAAARLAGWLTDRLAAVEKAGISLAGFLRPRKALDLTLSAALLLATLAAGWTLAR